MVICQPVPIQGVTYQYWAIRPILFWYIEKCVLYHFTLQYCTLIVVQGCIWGREESVTEDTILFCYVYNNKFDSIKWALKEVLRRIFDKQRLSFCWVVNKKVAYLAKKLNFRPLICTWMELPIHFLFLLLLPLFWLDPVAAYYCWCLVQRALGPARPPGSHLPRASVQYFLSVGGEWGTES